MNTVHDAGVSKHIGHYSDAIEVSAGSRLLFTSGTPGLDDNGNLPDTFEGQTRQTWANIRKALRQAGMDFEDMVKVSTSITNAADLPEYVKIRKDILGDVKPAFMLSVVDQLIRPDISIEVEVVAAKSPS